MSRRRGLSRCLLLLLQLLLHLQLPLLHLLQHLLRRLHFGLIRRGSWLLCLHGRLLCILFRIFLGRIRVIDLRWFGLPCCIYRFIGCSRRLRRGSASTLPAGCAAPPTGA